MDQSGASAPHQANPEQWVDEYGDYLYQYAFLRLRDTQAAEEVVQETFLAGIRFQDRYSGQGTERAWLLGILKRKIVDYIRLRNRFNRDGLTEDGSDPSAMLFDAKGNWKAGMLSASLPDQIAESKELWDVVRECLQHLPTGQADAFVLSVMEDLETEDICRQLEITPTNLWVRLHRARLALARCVNARWFEKEEEVTAHAK
ncbi:MAG: sigma-70 family RNA polymerase sigma factor [Planctomycetaceae bacterium]|nr:sigma-70 family RNA polymerase sigma factor [Planctomycetaceae bacterium]